MSLFHRSTIYHGMKNKINKLHTENGETLEEQEEISKELTRNFNQLLTKPNHSYQEAVHKVLHHIPPLFNNEHNQSLMQLITM